MRTRIAAGVLVFAAVALPRAQAAAPRDSAAVPRAVCGPGSRPETGLQGQVPRADRLSGRAAQGYSCNLTVVGRQGTSAGYNGARYRDCAYYTAAVLPGYHLAGARPVTPGVVVVDVKDSARPVEVDRLQSPAMLTPHESFRLHAGRGLLAAVTSTALTATPFVDVYDVKGDCRHPRLLASAPVPVTGHEGGFSPDGRTYWSSWAALTAIGLDDPSSPQVIAMRPGDAELSHGLGLSPDGRVLYLTIIERANGEAPGMIILDVGEVQDRRPQPRIRLLSRLTWPDVSSPQTALPFRYRGRPYVFVVDELGKGDAIGGITLIDVANPRRPRLVRKMKLEVQLAANQSNMTRDNDSGSAPFGPYTAHNCSLSGTVDPQLLLCAMLGSGTRVFDVRNPLKPREVAYFNPGPKADEVVGQTANLTGAWDPPVLATDRGELWFLNSSYGFFVARLAPPVLALARAQRQPKEMP